VCGPTAAFLPGFAGFQQTKSPIAMKESHRFAGRENQRDRERILPKATQNYIGRSTSRRREVHINPQTATIYKTSKRQNCSVL
jgi:hypothetical protein